MIMKAKRSKSSSDKISRLRRALIEKERELGLLRQISESISGNLDLDDLLRQVIGIVVKVTKADACLLYLYDSGKRELILKASQNPHPRLIGRIRLELGEGITGWVARERQLVAIDKNASDDPRFMVFQNLPEDRYQAFLSIPIISKNEMAHPMNFSQNTLLM